MIAETITAISQILRYQNGEILLWAGVIAPPFIAVLMVNYGMSRVAESMMLWAIGCFVRSAAA
jgi:hypothetical protein